MSTKRFYWLKLKEDFFEDDAIEWLEEQKNGKEYALFYLKLCLKSLKSDGLLMRKVGNILVPYDTNKLAEITRTSPDTVMVAMNLLQKIGLIEIMDGGAIYMSQLAGMTGSETDKAAQMRRLRARKALEMSGKNNTVTLLPECGNSEATNVTAEYRDKSIEYRDKSIEYRDKSIEYRDIDKENRVRGSTEGERDATASQSPPHAPEKKKSSKAVKHKHGEYKHVMLTETEHTALVEEFGQETTDDAIKLLDEYIEEKGYKSKSHNLAIRRWVISAVHERRRKSGQAPGRYGQAANVGPNGIAIDPSRGDTNEIFE